jgi:hypothetical protein
MNSYTDEDVLSVMEILHKAIEKNNISSKLAMVALANLQGCLYKELGYSFEEYKKTLDGFINFFETTWNAE